MRQQQVLEHRKDITDIARKYGVYNVRLFGSILDKTQTCPNDIDFLIELEDDRSLLDIVGFQQDLEQLLEMPIDVVLENSLHWYIKDRVIQEAKPL